jgi:tetratricopeptide (TPR) repeat protein
VESVAWISERKDVLSLCFGLLSLLAYTQYVRSTAAPRFQAGGSYVLALVCFGLGLMCKPMLVTWPFVMLLLDFWPLGRIRVFGADAGRRTVGRLMWEKGPFLALSVASCAVTLWAQRKAMQPTRLLAMDDRMANALVSYVRYLGKAVLPTGLAIPYPHPGEWSAGMVGAAAVLVAGLSGVAIWLRRRHPFVLTGWLIFLGTLVPVIGLVQVGSQSMADRYAYIPLIGVFIVLAWGSGEILKHRGWHKEMATLGAGVVLLVCGVLTWRQSCLWHDSKTLFLHAAEITEGNHVALDNVGVALFAEGRVDEAIEYYQRSLEARPGYVDALNNLGAALAAIGDTEAVEYYRHALAIDPEHAGARYNLATAAAGRARYEEAVRLFEETLRAKPDHLQAHNNLGNVLLQLGRTNEAFEHFETALKLKPDDKTIRRNVAIALVARGKLAEAIEHYRFILIQEPGEPVVHYLLGIALAVRGDWEDAIGHFEFAAAHRPDDAEIEYNLGYALRMKGSPQEAAIHLRAALRLRPEFPLAHFNLGCVLLDQGETAEATEHFNRALGLNPDYVEARQMLLEIEKRKGVN